ncbi:hypothetical protein PT974_06358 [Cladobotryum mycophilum]|uniref:DUF7702 domain-containing protein n=1 Tax=Cladobotryum mycophilum TaxID=491253 RepID=A0ABR0SLC4_9HYPO
MTLGYRDGVAVAELAVYLPSAIVGLYLTIINEFHTSGWIDILLFSIIRIVGSAIQLDAKNHPGTTKFYTIAAIMNSIGLAPLQAGSLGLLNRLNDNIRKNDRTPINNNVFRIVQIIIIVGLVLGVVGGIKSGENIGKTAGGFTVNGTSKAGSVLLIGVFALTLLLTARIFRFVSHADREYRRLLWAVMAATLPIGVRLVYAILATLTQDKDFNFITGNTTAWLCLAVVPETIIICIYIAVGLSLGHPNKRSHYKGERCSPAGLEAADEASGKKESILPLFPSESRTP